MPCITIPAQVEQEQESDIFRAGVRALRIEAEGKTQAEVTRKLKEILAVQLTHFFGKDSIKLYCDKGGYWTLRSTEDVVLMKRVLEISPLPTKEEMLDKHEKIDKAKHLKRV